MSAAPAALEDGDVLVPAPIEGRGERAEAAENRSGRHESIAGALTRTLIGLSLIHI